MILLLSLILWPMVFTQFNLYETDRKTENEQIQFDCLLYDTYTGMSSYEWITERTIQIIKYCRRPLTENDQSLSNISRRLDNSFTFKELRRVNVTVNQLLSWSASVDLVERYILYLEQPVLDGSSSAELFFNCSNNWFGSRCQYLFRPSSATTVDEVISEVLLLKEQYAEDMLDRTTSPSCYVHLQCDRGWPMCLDWREICNGQIDCIDGGADEAQCFELEMNECTEDEYRCQNGLCVPTDSYKDKEEHLDCLDLSDEPSTTVPFDFCYKDPSFRCEEQVCRSDSHRFPCGDGQCLNSFNNSCANGRSNLVKGSMFAKGNLSDSCWLFILCHTLMINEINESHCESIFVPSNVDSIDQFICESLFQFPTIPVLHGHVSFLYDNNQSRLMGDHTNLLLPDYICYDEKLCDFLSPTFYYRNLTCRHRQSIVDSELSYDEFLIFLNTYFRSCATSYVFANNTQYRTHPSIYCCKYSLKCISKHRLMDGVIDCYLGDDEKYEQSCSLKDKYRFRCSDQNSACWSSSVDPAVCTISNQKQSFSEIPFHNICDGVVHFLPQEINGKIYSDETECQHWPCSNIYTRCDAFKSCSDGRDEYGCLSSNCPPTFYPCISSVNYAIICLPMKQVADNIIDCLGATDELQHCHIVDGKNSSHCWQVTQCIAPSELCNYFRTCSGHFSEPFCKTSEEICFENESSLWKAQALFCALSEIKETVKFFSLATAREYPLSEQTSPTKQMNQKHVNNQTVLQSTRSESTGLHWIWRCHRGLSVSTRIGDKTTIEQCFCPPTYYGDSCEYQNQRVSLTLRLLLLSRRSLYVFVITLIDENGQINSYEQIIFSSRWGCSKKVNMYLLYSARPKNTSKTYSIHIDAFDKRTLTYHASWYLPIPFLFLPVNRIAANLIVPFQKTQSIQSCNLLCNNGGQCMKYVNIDKFFCHCHSNWSGPYCDVLNDWSDCSNDSLCVGSFNNRSMCVCPEYKIGPRCLISSPCPPNACDNNGQCELLQDQINPYQYFCVCPDQFNGFTCEDKKAKLEIAFGGMETAPYILVYIITKNEDESSSTAVFIRKLLQNQHTVTLYSVGKVEMAFVKFLDNYYLAMVKKSSNYGESTSTSITASQRCVPVDELFNSSLLSLPRIGQVKYYHLLCQNRADLWCFFDEIYMCLCTLDNHANCFEFNHKISFVCQHEDFCEHDALCFQDDITCPTSTICICNDCYFGTRCQFYAKGFGLILDDILRFEIQPNLKLSQQRISVKVSAGVTMLMFVIGLVSGVCSYLTFRRKRSQQVGCGLYLFASSITSILIVIISTLKFWFLFLSQTNFIMHRMVLRFGCKLIDFFLKFLIYTDGWLNGCVAIERAYAVSKGVNFDRRKSKRTAKWILFVMPIITMITIVHEPLNRLLYDDEEEHRIWCVTHYSWFVQNYNSAIILTHFLLPFTINLFSACFIIIQTARRRTATQAQLTYQQQILKQFLEHKQILVSPIALVILSLPRLIISLLSSCIKSSRNPWLYLVGYFISFVPSTLMFIIFVSPSDLYKKEFQESIKICQRSRRS